MTCHVCGTRQTRPLPRQCTPRQFVYYTHIRYLIRFCYEALGEGAGGSIGLTAAELQSGLDLTLFTETPRLSNTLVTRGLLAGSFALTVTILTNIHNQNRWLTSWIPTALAIKLSLHCHKKVRFMKPNTKHYRLSHTAILNTDKSFSTLRPEGAVGCNLIAELKRREYILISATQPTSAVLFCTRVPSTARLKSSGSFTDITMCTPSNRWHL